ncbi:MAG TPA: XRE family transcriptional regulator [Noviherbaspirillum sp.]|uniref:helix-turn-helix domain-containing protein n=1 Tax=Noviherbaspirillum sp. TaxID=1926288 RepID=UPI002B496C02|nr:XRE family transcriptional regulator [Noviherbaspirillum sp.]HJV85348.1 XRE family transcriptional regulator [Noviherbaspirillum sp.]
MTIRLKLLRRQMGWSLEVLAQQTGLTKSYLSKVERGMSVPSIAVALKLSKALGVDVEQLFSESHNQVSMAITRAADRTPMGGPGVNDSGVESIAATVAPKRMLPFVVHPPQDFAASAFKEHEGEEFLFVHKGSIEIEFPNETVRLKSGDSIYFNALIPHRTRSLGRASAEVLVVISQDDGHGA